MPRIDPKTMHRLVTDVAIKRKIRNMIPLIAGGTPALDIYVEFGAALSAQHERAYTELGLKLGDSIYKPPPTDQQKAQEWMWGTVISTALSHFRW
jgi:CRISPR-associated protein Csd2